MVVKASMTEDLTWTICDDNSTTLYQIRPYSNHLCYELFKWGETKRKDTGKMELEWKSLGVYPTDLAHACDIIRDKLVMDCSGTLNDFAQLKRSITQSTNKILKAIKSTEEVINDNLKV